MSILTITTFIYLIYVGTVSQLQAKSDDMEQERSNIKVRRKPFWRRGPHQVERRMSTSRRDALHR